MEQKCILYICSGNIYRSRYAEAFTNHIARERGITITAFSRGLTVHLVEECTSPYVVERLAEKGIPESFTSDCRQACTEADLKTADIIVAMKESEHRPMIEQQFPEWVDRIRYWHVHDVGEWKPEKALGIIESQVLALLDELT